eukprot:8336785-Alexandrium_andersonii.AAC.1
MPRLHSPDRPLRPGWPGRVQLSDCQLPPWPQIVAPPEGATNHRSEHRDGRLGVGSKRARAPSSV